MTSSSSAPPIEPSSSSSSPPIDPSSSSAPPIEQSVDMSSPFPSVTSRYYSRHYHVTPTGEDLCVLFHSNRICLLTLAPSHPVIKRGKPIKAFNFQVNDQTNRLNNEVIGKSKKGAQSLQQNSILCRIECEDGEVYTVRSVMKGKLIEINESLITQPNLALNAPQAEGYIAIMLPKLENIDQQRNKLLTEEKYQEHITTREETTADQKVTITDQKVATRDQEVTTTDQKVATRDQEVTTTDQKVATRDQDVTTTDQVTNGDKVTVNGKDTVEDLKKHSACADGDNKDIVMCKDSLNDGVSSSDNILSSHYSDISNENSCNSPAQLDNISSSDT